MRGFSRIIILAAPDTRTSREYLSWAIHRIIFTFQKTVGDLKSQGVIMWAIKAPSDDPNHRRDLWRSEEPWCFLLFVSRGAQQRLTMTALVMFLPTSFMSQNEDAKPLCSTHDNACWATERSDKAAIMSLKRAWNHKLGGSTTILNPAEILFTLINGNKWAKINCTKNSIKQQY